MTNPSSWSTGLRFARLVLSPLPSLSGTLSLLAGVITFLGLNVSALLLGVPISGRLFAMAVVVLAFVAWGGYRLQREKDIRLSGRDLSFRGRTGHVGLLEVVNEGPTATLTAQIVALEGSGKVPRHLAWGIADAAPRATLGRGMSEFLLIAKLSSSQQGWAVQPIQQGHHSPYRAWYSHPLAEPVCSAR